MVILVGAGGGFINALLLGNGTLRLPSSAPGEWNFGFLGNVLVGIAAALVVWASILPLSLERQATPIALGALGGASFLANYVQKRDIDLLEGKTGLLGDAVKTLNKPVPDPDPDTTT